MDVSLTCDIRTSMTCWRVFSSMVRTQVVSSMARTQVVSSLARWYIHFASCSPTVIYNVFMHNNAFWRNSNAFSLIICKVHTKRENSDSWKHGLGKATSGYLFCTTPNKLKLYGEFLWNIWRILEQISTRGGHPGEDKTPGRASVVLTQANLRWPSSSI